MNLLAIETTGAVAEVALLDEEGLAAVLAFRHRMELSRRLIPRIRSLLQFAGVEVRELDAVAVSLGPGSFTGVRIGVATAKGLALALDRPILGVPTLDALAAEVTAPAGTVVCPLVEARAGELYAAIYQVGRRGPERCADEMLVPAAELPERLAAFSGPALFVGDTAGYRDLLAGCCGEGVVAGTGRAQPHAEWVARLAWERLRAGESDDRMHLAPRYVRPSAAEARGKEASCGS